MEEAVEVFSSITNHLFRPTFCRRLYQGLLHQSIDLSFVFLQTSESYLHFYHIKVSEKHLQSSIQTNLDIPLINIVFSTSIDAALYNRTVTVYATNLIPI